MRKLLLILIWPGWIAVLAVLAMVAMVALEPQVHFARHQNEVIGSGVVFGVLSVLLFAVLRPASVPEGVIEPVASGMAQGGIAYRTRGEDLPSIELAFEVREQTWALPARDFPHAVNHESLEKPWNPDGEMAGARFGTAHDELEWSHHFRCLGAPHVKPRDLTVLSFHLPNQRWTNRTAFPHAEAIRIPKVSLQVSVKTIDGLDAYLRRLAAVSPSQT